MDKYVIELLEREQYAKSNIADLRGKVKKLGSTSMRAFFTEGKPDKDKFADWSYQYHCAVVDLAHARYELRQIKLEIRLYKTHCRRRSKFMKGDISYD